MSSPLDRIVKLSPERQLRLAAQLEPPSSGQERLWFLQQLDPASSAYNMGLALRLIGPLDVELLQRALDDLTVRHQVLRTVFVVLDGRPYPVTLPVLPVELARRDLEDRPEPERLAGARELAIAELDRTFDLGRGPLLRAGLFRLGPEEHLLLLAMHHVVSDQWSLGIILHEVGTSYEAHRLGQPARLPALRVQYADYARWQRAWLASPEADAQRAYWKRQLAGELPILELPGARPRPPVWSGVGGGRRRLLPRDLAAALRALGQREDATLFMMLLAGLATLLHRYTGLDDVLIATPIANRTHPDIEPLVGFFVNTLVLRLDLSGALTFRKLVGRTRAAVLDAFANCELPFDRLAADLGLPRDIDRNPLFQVMLVHRDTLVGRVETLPASIQVKPVDLGHRWSTFELTLHVFNVGDTIALEASYSADLFDADVVDLVLAHLETLLRDAAGGPDRRVAELTLLSREERHQLLVPWNGGTTPLPAEPLVLAGVEASADLTPGAAAVVFESERLCYGDLDALANGVAASLLDAGIGRGALVPLLMDRGFELVIAELGILKAGAAFVPLDVHWPDARCAAILDALGAPLLLVDRSSAARARSMGRAPLIVDRAGPRAPRPACARATLDDPMYVIYTSGSTGAPKGVIVSHGGVSNRLAWMNTYFTAACAGAVLATTRHVHDSAVWQIFWPLMHSGKTVLPGPDDASGEALAALIAAEDVVTTDFVPSILSVLLPDLVSEAGRAALASLRCVVVGGEAISSAAVHRFRVAFPAVRVINLYGPTEASIGCIFHEVRGDEGDRIPIGRPIPNTCALLLDRERHLAPVGVIAELYLAGRCLARGYLGDPEATRVAFIANPFPEIDFDRLYRTGDLARRRADGAIEFCGRADDQVKIHGMRIEPEEVRAALARHPLVEDGAVVALADGRGEPRLVAYFVPRAAPPPSSAELRAFLRDLLPFHAIPAVFVPLDAIPRRAAGKLDRAALPAPAWPRAAGAGAPQTPAEEVLVAIWATTLDARDVGIHDDFFAFGGHSLLAVQIVARVRDAFGVKIPLRAIFDAPSVAQMADLIAHARRAPDEPPELPLVAGDGDEMPLAPAQERLWALDQCLGASAELNICSFVRVLGWLDRDALTRALAEVVRRHTTLRSVFVVAGGRLVQRVASSATPVPVWMDLTHLPDAEQAAAIRAAVSAEASLGFDLARGPLLRLHALRVSAEEHVVLLTVHHIIGDGWSMNVLRRELEVLYAAFSEGRPSPLPELTLQYADFAVWQRRCLADGARPRQLAYWRGRLAGDLPPIVLPAQIPDPPPGDLRGARLRFSLEPALTHAVKRLSRDERCTVFMTLFAAFEATLHAATHQDEMRIATLVSNRGRTELEGLIGLFVNTLLLRTNLAGDPSFRDVLRRVRDAALGAYGNQDLPFEEVVRDLEQDPRFDRRSLFRVLFLWETAPRPAALPGITLSPVLMDGDEPELMTTSADLIVVLGEAADRIEGRLFYKLAHFDRGGLDRLLAGWGRLIAAVTAGPELRLSELRTPAALEVTQRDSSAPGE